MVNLLIHCTLQAGSLQPIAKEFLKLRVNVYELFTLGLLNSNGELESNRRNHEQMS